MNIICNGKSGYYYLQRNGNTLETSFNEYVGGRDVIDIGEQLHDLIK